MNRKPVFFIAVAAALTGLGGCRQDMQDQPKMRPLRHSAFFSDGRSARQQVTGTVARSQMPEDNYFSSGLLNGGEGDALPFPLTYTVMRRGQEQFNIYCSPCHSRVGNGRGMIVERGYHPAANLQSERLRDAPLGHFFAVISRGYGTMPDYSGEIAPVDRWAIAAYIRALQLSQHAAQSNVPKGTRAQTLQAILRNSGYAENFLASWETPYAGTSSVPSHGDLKPASTTSSLTNAVDTAESTTKRPPVLSSAVTSSTEKLVRTTTVRNEEATHKGNPTQGKQLYSADCSMCHQINRAGVPPQIPSLIGTVDRLGEKKVRDVAKFGVPTGVPPMPPHPDLSEADIDNLIAFLKDK